MFVTLRGLKDNII